MEKIVENHSSVFMHTIANYILSLFNSLYLLCDTNAKFVHDKLHDVCINGSCLAFIILLVSFIKPWS